MSDEKVVYDAIELFVSTAWTTTPVGYPNTTGVNIGGAGTDLSEGTADYVEFSVTFGPRIAREVGATSVRRDGVLVFHAHTRVGSGDSVLHDFAGRLLDMFSWKPVIANVVFEDGRAFTPFDNKEWRSITCSIDFYFHKT